MPRIVKGNENEASTSRGIQKILKSYCASVDESVKAFRRAKQNAVRFGRKLADSSAEGNTRGKVCDVLEGRHPMDHEFFDSLRQLSQQRLNPTKAQLESHIREKGIYRIRMRQHRERSQFHQNNIKSAERKLHDHRTRHNELEERYSQIQHKLHARKEKLQSVEQTLNAPKTKVVLHILNRKQLVKLREDMELTRRQIKNLEIELSDCSEQLDQSNLSLIATAERTERFVNREGELLNQEQEMISELKSHLSNVKQLMQSTRAKINAERSTFGAEIIRNLEQEVATKATAVLCASHEVKILSSPLPAASRRVPIGPEFDAWILDCRKRRKRATRLLTMGSATTKSADDLEFRANVIREVQELGRREETRRRLNSKRRAQLARQRQAERERADRERERREARREQQIVTANRRDLRRVAQRLQTATAALQEFEREHRRLDYRIELNQRNCELASTRIQRLIRQIIARRPDLTPDYIRKNSARFPALDNALDREGQLDAERKLLANLHRQREALKKRKYDAEDRHASEVRSQSTSKGGRGRPPRVEVNVWEDAERLAEMYMIYLGYPDAQRTNTGPDGGVDVESARAVAQVKDQGNPVGRHLIQQLYGVAHSKRKKAIFFARSYAPPAIQWAHENGVALYVFRRDGQVHDVH